MRVMFVLKNIEEENLGVLYLSALLKKKGHHTQLVKADYKCVSEALRGLEPTILAYSTLAFYSEYYVSLNKQIKKDFDVFSLFGGMFPTARPELIYNDGVDAICVGEGEYPLVELADALSNGKDFRSIQNLWIKDKDKIWKNPLRPLISDLDTLPFPDRGLFRKKSPFFNERISVITSRGCAYDCPYCYNSTLARLYKGQKNLYRRRSVNKVIEEIQCAQRAQKVRFIMFHDDIFILLPQWLEEFSEKYSSKVSLPFSCNVRIDLINPENVSLLKEAGCHSVSFGIESGDEETRTNLFNRSMDKQNIINAARLIRDSGIRIRTTNIIGARPDSVDRDIETLRLNIACGVDLAKVGVLSTYPNTGIIAKVAQDENWAQFVEAGPKPLISFFKMFSPNLAYRFQRLFALFPQTKGLAQPPRERRKLENLYIFFPLVVGFPSLLLFIRFLLRLPMARVFLLPHYLWDTYCNFFRIYSFGSRNSSSKLINKKISVAKCR